MQPQTISSMILAILLFTFSVILTYQTVRKQRRTWSFTVAIYIGFLITFADTLRLFITHERGLSLPLIVIALILWSLMFILVFIFFQQLNSETINPYLLTFVLVFFLGEIIFGVLQLFDLYLGDVKQVLILLWDFNYDALGVLIFGYGAILHLIIYRKTNDMPALTNVVALVLITLGFIWGFIGDVFNFMKNTSSFLYPDTLETILANYLYIGDVIKALGILVFISAYVFKIDYIFRHPFEIDSIIIFNKIGLLVYGAQYVSHHDKEDEKDILEIPFELIGASINAVSSFIADTTGSTQPLRKIITGDKVITINKNEFCSVVVVSDKTSYFLLQSMNNMLNQLTKTYAIELSNKFVDSDLFIGVREMILMHFPYLEPPIFEKM
ncbi:MAG: hypothetical protein ACTSQE_12830 [Candidatus Heimdallarchaeaceae archaeon]